MTQNIEPAVLAALVESGSTIEELAQEHNLTEPQVEREIEKQVRSWANIAAAHMKAVTAAEQVQLELMRRIRELEDALKPFTKFGEGFSAAATAAVLSGDFVQYRIDPNGNEPIEVGRIKISDVERARDVWSKRNQEVPR